MLLIAAAAQWLMPGSMFSGDVLVMKLVLTAALAGLAAVLFRFADRGSVTELQVDAALREIRVGDRTLSGVSRIRNRIPMREIEEVFVRPDRDEPGQTELCFRVAGRADPDAHRLGMRRRTRARSRTPDPRPAHPAGAGGTPARRLTALLVPDGAPG